MLHSSRRFKEITARLGYVGRGEAIALRIGDVLEKFKAHARLSFYGDIESPRVLNKIPDDSLETLSLSIRYHDQLPDEEHLQDIVNRQMKLKKLKFPEGMKLVLVDLDLEELTLDAHYDVEKHVAIDKWLAANLKHQPALRVLRCGTVEPGSMASIGFSAFNELQKLRSLEVLHGSF